MNKIKKYLSSKIAEFRLIFKAVISTRYVRKRLLTCNSIDLEQARELSSDAFDQTYYSHKSLPDFENFEIDRVGSMVFITDMFYQIRKNFEAKDEVSGLCSKEIKKIKLDISDSLNAKMFYKVGFLDRAIISEIIDEYENNFSKIQIIK